tara:strand:- start:52 stop:273 length:222 start_codon:yes stop_codon:yes gene_type:complete
VIENFKKLHAYLITRSEFESMEFPLEVDHTYFQFEFEQGVRSFFGVILDEEAQIIYDHREPQEGLLISFLNSH